MSTPSQTGAAIYGLAGPDLSDKERDFFRAARPWGFILFARNVETPAQLMRLTADLREAAGFDAPVLIDQEGGRVQRLRAPLWREWLPPLEEAAHGLRAAYLRAALMARELRAAGIDTNCAPTCDIAGPLTHPFLRNRCWGESAATVAEFARATMDGFLAAGVLPVVKHMPGHGRASADSHHDLPSVEASLDDLRASDFAVFKALRDAPMAMSAHIRFTQIDEAPATQSAVILELIRREIGFDGLLMTDDIAMQALSGPVGQRAEKAIAAGCDVILHCNGDLAEMQAVAEAAGALSKAAIARADRALAQRHARATLDFAALEAEFSRLTARGSYA